jgi:hypothetical protein
MTQKEAKKLTLELWGYLAKHPECRFISEIQPELRNRIFYLFNKNPLCEVFLAEKSRDSCGSSCPLGKAGEDCFCADSPWRNWATSASRNIRKKAAERIVEIVSKWEPEERE